MPYVISLAKRAASAVIFCAALVFVQGAYMNASAAEGGFEYFVALDGNDGNNGLSRDAAFRTIQTGLNALAAGDTLTILPGEYHESASRAGLGAEDRDTIIRADIPGTVLLRGDVPAPRFGKVEGYRFVYAASLEEEPHAVLEWATMSVLEKKPSVLGVEFDPGASYYDGANKTLYISSADLQSPENRYYTVVTNGKSGLFLDRPVRVIIDGLAAAGYYRELARRPGSWLEDWQWGIALDAPASCTVRRCTTFLNAGGIVLNNGRRTVVEDCVSHDNSQTNIQYYGGNNHSDNVVRDCYAYRAQSGINSYMVLTGPMLFVRNIAWGNGLDYSNKSGNESSTEFGFMENCIALSNMRVRNLKNCIFGGTDNEYGRGVIYAKDNILFNEEPGLDVDREFADPVNMDFRLQGDSRFRGTAEDGKDRGIFPEHNYRIYFLSPDGEDGNDGTSLRKSWKSLGRALETLLPGDTIYLTEGVYSGGDAADKGEPGTAAIRIRGRGRDRVVIEGIVNAERFAGIEFERIQFADAVNMRGGEGIAFKNCVFSGDDGLAVDAVRGLTITHTVFENSFLHLNGAGGVFLSGNLYMKEQSPAVILEGDTEIAYSDYNNYQNSAACWAVRGATLSLVELQKNSDRYSEEIAVQNSDGGVPAYANLDALAGHGPLGAPVGPHQEYQLNVPRLVGPIVHSVTDTTANIEWWTSTPATCEIAWGETPAMENTAVRSNPYRFGSFSLTGLKPGQRCYFKIKSVQASADTAPSDSPKLTPEGEPLAFATHPAASAPAIYYVALDGDDRAAGTSRDQAWRTISHAADKALAGDTVLIAGGTYGEMVRIRATGAPGKPLIFRGMPGEKVIIDGIQRSLSQAFIALDKHNVIFDFIYFTNFSGPAIYLRDSRDVNVMRCFSDGRGPGYAGPLLVAQSCPGLVARNCISINGMGSGMQIIDSPDVLIENNVFLRNLIYGCVLVNDPDQKIVMRRNIFADSLPFKAAVAYHEIAKIESIVDADNCYYIRLPDDERKMFLFYGNAAYDLAAKEYGMRSEFDEPPVTPELVRMSLAEFKKIKGETGSFIGNPHFAGTAGMQEGETTVDRGTRFPVLLSDKLVNKPDLDFQDVFSEDPRLIERNIGLVPDEFAECGIERQ